jgi:Ni/Co efflux regulator RcnB
MNTKAVISAILAISLATGGLAFGQGKGHDNGKGNDRGRDENSQRGGQDRDGRDDRRSDRRDRDDRQFDRRDHDGRQDHRDHDRRWGYQNDRRDSRDGRGAGPNHTFYRGGRLPVEYRHRHYVIEDWRGYHLSAPPRGYHWVQTGSDYVLIAIATGIIASIFLSQY